MWEILIIYLSLYIKLSSGQDHPVDASRRVDCYPEPGANQKFCSQRSCFWDSTTNQDEINRISAPQCYLPQRTGYVVLSKNDKETVLIKEQFPPPYENPQNPYGFEGGDIQLIVFTSKQLGPILNVHFAPRAQVIKRYEPEIGIIKNVSISSSESLELRVYDQETFTFSVHRCSTNTTIFDTRIGGQMFADKYIQVASYLSSDKIYGWGQNVHQTLKHDFSKYKTWSMFARDEAPNSAAEDTKNLYGVHPFYMGIENDGKAHGVFFFNSNAQEVTTGPGPHFIYRTIGGLVDIYFFPGPTPEEVIKQYQSLIGNPSVPPYWGLGFQLSRMGYSDLSDLQAAVERTQKSNIPLDVVAADIDYMDSYTVFTVQQEGWSGLGNYAKTLHNNGMHMTVALNPAIDVKSQAFIDAKNADASFIEYPEMKLVQQDIQSLYPSVSGTKIMLAVAWPNNHVAFPDFNDPTEKTRQWWRGEMQKLHDIVEFDGVSLDMNEPAAFGTNEDQPSYGPNHSNITALDCRKLSTDAALFDAPLFKTSASYRYGTNARLSAKTLCLAASTARNNQILFNTKNLYGTMQASYTKQGLQEITSKRPLIVSRSTFPSMGRYGGSWLGENNARWEDLRTSIIGVQEFNLFGIPYVGADICGFSGATSEELCLRWHQLGAFYSYARNHNAKGTPNQDPGIWESVANAAREAFNFRYSYLPYLYTLHFIASKEGGTVIRPLFFEFPHDLTTHNTGYQFMWGSGILVIPVTEPGIFIMKGYLPTASSWYSLRSGDYGKKIINGETVSTSTDELIPVFARGGVIIPRQASGKTTTETRKNPFELVVALEFKNKQPLMASGRLFWDDGESIIEDIDTYPNCEWGISFLTRGDDSALVINAVALNCNGRVNVPSLDVIDVFGFPYAPDFSTVKVNNISVDASASSYDESKSLLRISAKNLTNLVSVTSTITWSKTAPSTETTAVPSATTTISSSFSTPSGSTVFVSTTSASTSRSSTVQVTTTSASTSRSSTAPTSTLPGTTTRTSTTRASTVGSTTTSTTTKASTLSTVQIPTTKTANSNLASALVLFATLIIAVFSQ